MAKAKKKVVKVKKAKPVKKAAKPVQKSTKKPALQAKKKKTAQKKTIPVVAKKSSNWTAILTPLDDRLIIEVTEGERRTAGGLIIPDTVSMTGNFQGKVVLVGRGHRDNKGRIRPMDVKPGDTVLFSEHSGSKIEVMGSELKILRESEILGILEKS